MATAYRATRVGWAFLGLCWLVVLTAGCGSSEYDAQLKATAEELRQGQPAKQAAPAKAEQGQAAKNQPTAQAKPKQDKKGSGYGSPVANSLLAPP